MSYSGPHVKEIFTGGGKVTQHIYRTVVRPPGGYREPIPYFCSRYEAGEGYWGQNTANNIISDFGGRVSDHLNSSVLYDKLQAKLGAKSEMLMNAFEGRKTWQMVALRAGQLVTAARHILRGRARQAVRTLGLQRHPRSATFIKRWKGNTRQSAQAWLEFTFGWAPVASDMASAAKVFEHEFKAHVRVQSEILLSSAENNEYAIGPDNLGNYTYYGAAHAVHGFGVAYAGADVRIVNPNAFLANRLGLVNLGSVLWDATPFSFVLDWFGKFGTYIRSLTDQVGIEWVNGYRGWFAKGNGIVRHTGDTGNRSFGPNRKCVVSAMGRSKGLPPKPSLFDRLRIPEFSPWLAITSVALLVSTLGSMKGARYDSELSFRWPSSLT